MQRAITIPISAQKHRSAICFNFFLTKAVDALSNHEQMPRWMYVLACMHSAHACENLGQGGIAIKPSTHHECVTKFEESFPLKVNSLTRQRERNSRSVEYLSFEGLFSVFTHLCFLVRRSPPRFAMKQPISKANLTRP